MSTTRGRPPRGAAHAQRADGSAAAKERLTLILKTLSGERTVAQAAAQLGVTETHFHRLRERALQGAAEALEPRPSGRPRAGPQAVDPQRVDELQEQVEDLELELLMSQLREQMALVMPDVLVPTAEQARKKKNERKRRRRGRRKKT